MGLAGSGAPTKASAGASTPLVWDSFNRATASGGWGQSDSGGLWIPQAGNASKFSTTQNALGSNVGVFGVGHITVDSGAEYATLAAGVQDVEVVGRFTIPANANTYDNGLMARYVASSGSWYQLSFYATNNGAISVSLKRKPANTLIISPDFVTNLAGNGSFWLRLRCIGVNPTYLMWNMWADRSAELTGWIGTASDSTAAMQGPGDVGMIGFVSAGTMDLQVSSFIARALSSASYEDNF